MGLGLGFRVEGFDALYQVMCSHTDNIVSTLALEAATLSRVQQMVNPRP